MGSCLKRPLDLNREINFQISFDPGPTTHSVSLCSRQHRVHAVAKQSVTVRVEPELVRWFREEAHIPLGEAVNEALRGLQQRLLSEQLQQRIDRELAEGEALVSQADLSYWDQLSDA